MTASFNPPPQRYSFAQLEALWIQAGGSQAAAPMAAAVALAESSGNPTEDVVNTGGAYPGSHDRGLWQMNSVAHSEVSNPFDPLANARAAVRISNNGANWRPWCSAWSNNDCSGTYLGNGSNAVAHLQQNSNVAPATLAQLTSAQGGAASGGSTGISTTADNSGCAIPITLPVYGNTCLMTHQQLRVFLGGLLIVAGGVTVIVGIVLTGMFGARRGL